MKAELLKNTLIIGAGRMMTQFMGFLLLPLYTTFLSPSEYGTADLVITYASLALPLVTLSLEQGAFRLLVDARGSDEQKTNIISYVLRVTSRLIVVMWSIVLLLGFLLGDNFSIIPIALLYITSSVLLNTTLWFTRGFGDSKAYSLGSVIVGLSSLCLNVIFVALLHLGAYGMLSALAFANLIGVIYFVYKLKLFTYFRFSANDKNTNKELLKYSLPLIPNSISWWLINAVDRTIITIFLGVAATGIYAVAAKFPAVLVGLFSVFWISWHESASLYINHKDKDEFFTKVANTSLVLFGSIALLIIATLSVVYSFVIEAEFNEAYIYVPILMAGALCSTMISLYGSIYAAKKTTRQVLNTTIMAAIINVSVMLALIMFIDLYAAAFASVVAYLSLLIYRHRDIKKYVDIKINPGKLVLLAGAAMVVVSLYYINHPILNWLNVGFICVFGLAVNRNIIFSVKDLVLRKA